MSKRIWGGGGVRCYTGLWGSGKTLSMALECQWLVDRGVEVYTNFGFASETASVETFDDLLRLCSAGDRKRRHVALDEMGFLLPARLYNQWPQALNLLFLQGRKFGFSLSYSAQAFELVDANIRRVTGYVCRCRGMGRIKTGDPIEPYRPGLFIRSWVHGEQAHLAKPDRLSFQVYRAPRDRLYDTHKLIEVAQRQLSEQWAEIGGKNE